MNEQDVEVLLKRVESKLPAHWKAVLVVLGIAIALLVAKNYADAQRDAAVALAQTQAHAQEDKRREEDNARIEKLTAAIREDANNQIAALEKRIAQVKTPEQAVKIIHETVPVANPDSLSNQDKVDLANFGLKCQVCETDREAQKKELSGLRQQQANDAVVIANQKQDVDSLKKELKGDSWFKRALRSGRDIAIGIAIGSLLKH